MCRIYAVDLVSNVAVLVDRYMEEIGVESGITVCEATSKEEAINIARLELFTSRRISSKVWIHG